MMCVFDERTRKKRSGITLREEVFMKKLLAVALSLCLLCSFALAEETPELSWENSLSENPNLEANGSTQQISVDGVGNILYWVPNNLPASDVSTIEAELPPIAAFGADNEGNSYSVSVFALTVTGGLEAYAAAQKEAGADVDNAKLIIPNGLQIIGMENPVAGIDMILLPVNDSTILLFTFTPLNGDEEWDEVKTYIASSIRLAQ
jgi:hypothetical protein